MTEIEKLLMKIQVRGETIAHLMELNHRDTLKIKELEEATKPPD
jgi:hypothetical protein